MLDNTQFLITLIVISFTILLSAAYISREVRQKVWTLAYPTVPYIHHHHDEYKSLHRCAACESSGKSPRGDNNHTVTIAPVVMPATTPLLPMQANWQTTGSVLQQRDSFVTKPSAASKPHAAASANNSEPDSAAPAAAETPEPDTAPAASASDPPDSTPEQQPPTHKEKDSFQDPTATITEATPPVSANDGFRDHRASLTPYHNQSHFHTSFKTLR